MSDVYITIPKPATFIDPGSKKTALAPNADGVMTGMVDRDHEWFVHVYILSHLQFDVNVGGAEAARASREIARALEKAVVAKDYCYAISEDNLRRIRCCLAKATAEDWKESLKDKAEQDPRILAKSTLGMARHMDNFSAMCFVDHFNAFEHTSAERPPAPVGATGAVGDGTASAAAAALAADPAPDNTLHP